jgi:hypothetical protein
VGSAIAQLINMNKLILICSVFLLAACSKTSSKQSAENKSSTTPGPNILDLPIPLLTNQQVEDIGQDLGAFIFHLISQFQGTEGNVDFNNNSVSYSQLFNCPISGTVGLTGQAAIDADLGIGTLSGQLLSGTGSITFAFCKLAMPDGAILTLTGTLTLTSLTGALNATYNLNGGAFTVNSASGWNGNLHVTVGTFDKACAFNGTHTTNGSGNVDTNFWFTGNATVNLTGQLCGQNLNTSFSQTLN